MRNKTLFIWGRRPQTPAIFRFTARMAGGTINALERRIGLSSDGTRAPTQGPEWQGAAYGRPPLQSETRRFITYCGRKMVLTTGTTLYHKADNAIQDIVDLLPPEEMLQYSCLRSLR